MSQGGDDGKTGGSGLTLGSKTTMNFNTQSYKPSSLEKNNFTGASKPLTGNTSGFGNSSKKGSLSVDKTEKKPWDDDEEVDFKSRPKTSFGSKNQSSAADNKSKGNAFWDLDDENDVKAVDYNTVNLNKLSTEELEKHKKKMDVLFSKNQKKPGDPGFVYDVQQEFNPHEDNEWDEEL